MRRLGVILSLMVLGACGIPLDQEPRLLDVEVPTEAADASSSRSDLPVNAKVYFVDDDRLVAVSRRIADTAPTTALEALLRGPFTAEMELSIRSAIPAGTAVLGVAVSDFVATVDLSPEFTLVGGDEEILAVAQIVATASAVEGVDGVILAIDGTRRNAPVAEGRLVERPLVPADFTGLFSR
jgi:spore germination protein GerM